MLGWGASERRVTSSKELRDVDMYVYTLPAGLLGRYIGRALRFRVERFAYDVDPAGRSLRRVVVEADSLLPQCEVDRRKFERLLLNFSEVERLSRRVRSYTLDAPRFPRILYEVERETQEHLEGSLQLCGETRPVRCSKALEGPELVVRCPIDTREFNVPRYSILFGLFSVSPHVEVETRVPLKVLRL
ncbi:uncharacterized protein Tco025E_00153 [Trypanosoma conorhini]|uniref:Lipid/polyisoprenoid-binding YceI-like domain-containing protein n=1 Tax=Trypanosoma conorhini TaxID=83891 RepID=A0A3R7PMF4_9TRYP|nr:uncharacterized protein Tco025E_00153 [Trypanosoma conorhini]RNF27592.1 hypothetical protein Tco025E_00153 [Trypanosoma conorhini]